MKQGFIVWEQTACKNSHPSHEVEIRSVVGFLYVDVSQVNIHNVKNKRHNIYNIS